MAGTEYCLRMLRLLLTVRKFGVAMKNASTSAARITRAPPRPPPAAIVRTSLDRTIRMTDGVVASAMDTAGCRHDLVLVGFGAELAHDPPPGHHDDPVRQTAGLLYLRSHVQNGRALGGEVANQTEDLFFGPDVDAPRRIVEYKNLCPGAQPPSENRLLLVSPRERLRQAIYGVGSDRQVAHESLGQLPLGPKVQYRSARDSIQRGQGDVASDGHPRHGAEGSILGKIPNAPSYGVHG